MTQLLAEYLRCLERSLQLDGIVGIQQLSGRLQDFLKRRWLVLDGYQTHLLVPVGDGEADVELEIDEDAGVFRYTSPRRRLHPIERPLSEIALYAFNVEEWLNALTEVFDFEPSRRARKRCLIPDHLWHLGDARVARSHDFAPIYVARRLQSCQEDWCECLSDRIRLGQGIVLVARKGSESLPNDHQQRELDDLLLEGSEVLDTQALERLLETTPVGTGDEYFDVRSGALKLRHMKQARIFQGAQARVIALFWKNRYNASGLKWSEVVSSAHCSKDPDSVFGKGKWQDWLERVGRGSYRLRIDEHMVG